MGVEMEMDFGGSGSRRIAVLVNKSSRSSSYALQWTLDHLAFHDDTIILVHVRPPVTAIPTPLGNSVPINELCEDVVATYMQQVDSQTYDLFVPYQDLCLRRQISFEIKVLEDVNIPAAIVKYASTYHICRFVIGTSSQNAVKRIFMPPGVAAKVANLAPGFCTVYVVSKGKLCSVKSAVSLQSNSSKGYEHSCSSLVLSDKGNHTEPFDKERERQALRLSPQMISSLHTHHQLSPEKESHKRVSSDDVTVGFYKSVDDFPVDFYKSMPRLQLSLSERRLGPEKCHAGLQFRSKIERFDAGQHETNGDYVPLLKGTPAVTESDNLQHRNDIRARKLSDYDSDERSASLDIHSTGSSYPSTSMQSHFGNEAEILELDLNQCEDMCIETSEGENRQEAKETDAYRIQVLPSTEALGFTESNLECNVDMGSNLKASEDSESNVDFGRLSDFIYVSKSVKEGSAYLSKSVDRRFKQYSIQEIEEATDYFAESLKIGEGSYGSVYKCILDDRTVAVKVLHPDAAQGWKQFKQEVEVLGSMQHPHIVLLLGVCPEVGCLVYEYLANGNLEDRLFRKGATPPIPWHIRFRIASEIATGLLFLHTTKPKPLVHRDLKPGNILLDDKFISKIGDAGLAKLVSADVSGPLTELKNTTTSGTFCYIDPEYQQTGVLGTKSDLYALGVVLLQLLTAKQPMGLAYKVERAIGKGSFKEILDQTVKDWPVKEALDLAKLALKCVELRRKDRPDLETVVLPDLLKLRAFAESFHDLGKQGIRYNKVSHTKRLWFNCRKFLESSKSRFVCECYGLRNLAKD